MTKTITLDNPGPIEGTFPIELKGPGVYEFRGRRGSGKSTCISSLDWLAGHKVDITLHDGAVSGKVEGFGVVAPIGGRKRRKGDLDVDTIDAEKFTVTDILDPQGKTPAVRDTTRIKALAVLSGAEADPSLYYELAGGQAEFDALGIAQTDDPVMLATRVKRAYDEAARKSENTAEAEAKHAAPLEHVPEGLDLEAESDLTVLGEHRDKERDEFTRMSKAREDGIAQEAKIHEAQQRLEKVKSDYTGSSVEDAEREREVLVNEGKLAKKRVVELEEQLKQARADLEACTVQYNAANQTLEAAKSHAAAVVELEEIASESADYPSQDDVDAAEKLVREATTAYQAGVRIRDVKQNHIRAKSHREAEKAASKAAAESRNKAGQVLDVLAKSLSLQHLQIISVDGDPRLFAEHPKRGRTAFDRVNGLSDGERADFTLKELLPHIKTPGVLLIPQRVWQDLQPSDRENLHELTFEKGLYLFGAQVDDGELRVVYYGDAEEGYPTEEQMNQVPSDPDPEIPF